MQNGSSLEASSDVVTSDTAGLAVDVHTVGKLSETAERIDEWGCCIMTANNE